MVRGRSDSRETEGKFYLVLNRARNDNILLNILIINGKNLIIGYFEETRAKSFRNVWSHPNFSSYAFPSDRLAIDTAFRS